MAGQYNFIFSNMKDRVNTKYATIAIHPGKDVDETPKTKTE